MIKQISIKDVASYKGNPVVIGEMKKVCFMYGANGSGKTTISRIIKNPESYPTCSIVRDNSDDIEMLVYNKDFKESIFLEDSTMAGVFTMGEGEVEARNEIKEKEGEIKELKHKIEGEKKEVYGKDKKIGLKQELENLQKEFENNCWKIKTSFDSKFKMVFKSHMGSKREFAQQILINVENKSELKSENELIEKYNSVFQSELNKEEFISPIDANILSSFEDNSLFSVAIVGKKDIDIAGLIEKMKSSDWVHEGYVKYYKHNDGICPFCQQQTPQRLMHDFEEYFDESYRENIDKLKRVLDDYERIKESTIALTTNIVNKSDRIEVDKFLVLTERLKSLTSENMNLINLKIDEPSRKINLKKSKDVINEINGLIKKANDLIRNHNATIENIEEERTLIKNEVWKYLIEEKLGLLIKGYLKTSSEMEKEISGKEKSIQKKEKIVSEKEKEIKELWKKASSTQPTVDEINKILKAYGFTNFKIARDESGKFYKIVRNNNDEAKNTLSEGEISFVTFLYFYNYIKGSFDNSSIVGDRILVFDDPVSSLDSEVLFIVSNLIQKLINDMIDGTNNIRQVILLTHNVYFYRQASYLRMHNEQEKKYIGYWIVFRRESGSAIESYEDNPIKSSYQLLWKEYCSDSTCKQVLPNVMRRIIEHYFTFSGKNLSNICDEFHGLEKQVCNSLITWAHAGSHLPYEDLYYVITDEIISCYKNVFRSIFELSGHEAHYEMMMENIV